MKKNYNIPILKEVRYDLAMIHFCNYAARHMAEEELVYFKKISRKDNISIEKAIFKYLNLDFKFSEKLNSFGKLRQKEIS